MAEVTLTPDGFTPTNPPPAEGGPLLLVWPCGCTGLARWATGLTITHHDTTTHYTEYTLRPDR